jgi:hypothetical protein
MDWTHKFALYVTVISSNFHRVILYQTSFMQLEGVNFLMEIKSFLFYILKNSEYITFYYTIRLVLVCIIYKPSFKEICLLILKTIFSMITLPSKDLSKPHMHTASLNGWLLGSVDCKFTYIIAAYKQIKFCWNKNVVATLHLLIWYGNDSCMKACEHMLQMKYVCTYTSKQGHSRLP